MPIKIKILKIYENKKFIFFRSKLEQEIKNPDKSGQIRNISENPKKS